MLVLSRKVGQEIVVGDNVRITVTKVSGNRVTLGVDAPDNVRILRGELEQAVDAFDDGVGQDLENVPGVFAQTVARVGDVVDDILPFVPITAR